MQASDSFLIPNLFAFLVCIFQQQPNKYLGQKNTNKLSVHASVTCITDASEVKPEWITKSKHGPVQILQESNNVLTEQSVAPSIAACAVAMANDGTDKNYLWTAILEVCVKAGETPTTPASGLYFRYLLPADVYEEAKAKRKEVRTCL